MWFKLGATPQYYPLVHTTFWIEYHLWGLNPQGYHVVNMLLHGLSAVLAWRLLSRLEVPGAWLAAALFAVHPVEVESVAWITERKNVLSMSLALGSLLAYFRYCPPQQPTNCETQAIRRKPAWGWYALSLLMYVCALWSKTVTASVPAVVLVIFWWKRGAIRARDVLPLLPFFAVGLSLASVTAWMERSMVGAVGDHWAFSWLDRILIAGRALCFYVSKLAWPHSLCFFYVRWQIDDHAWWQYLYPLAALAVMVGLWLARPWIGRGPLAAVLIFAGVLVPALGFFNIYPFLFSFVADHFQYHASIALLALAAATGTLLARRFSAAGQRVCAAIAAGVILLLMAISYQRTHAFESLMTLYQDTIRTNPMAWSAHHNYGYVLEGQGKYPEAIAEFREAIRLFPTHDRLRISLASALFSQGQFDAAAEELTQALAGNLDSYDTSYAHVHLGNVRTEQRRFDDAFAEYQAALAIMPNNWKALYNYGVALEKQGDTPGAVEKIRAALKYNRDYPEAYNSLGKLLSAQGNLPEAVINFEAATRLVTRHAPYFQDLGEALFRLGEVQKAQTQFLKAVEFDPNQASTHNALGVTYASLGDLSSAIREFETALRIDPQHAGAADNLQKAKQAQQQTGP